MKMRSGFVSNSSSSSFIVGFERVPETVEEMKKLLFGDGQYVTYYDYSISTQEAAETVLKDLKAQDRQATMGKIIDTVNSGYFEGYPSYDYTKDRESDLLRKEFEEKFPIHKDNLYSPDKIRNKQAKELAEKYQKMKQDEWDEETRICDEAALNYAIKEVLPKFRGKNVYVFEYADESNQCVMEHGDIFSNLPHIRISHH